jgi:predicted permease
MRFAFRLLLVRPGYSLVAILAIALGVAAATTLFSVANGVLLRPLPWADADRLVQLTEIRGGRQGRIPNTILNGTYHAWSESPQTIESIAAWRDGYKVTLSGDGDAVRLPAASMTPATLTTLDASPILGRGFNADEGGPGRQQVVLISFASWQRRFGGRPDIIGRPLIVNGNRVEIIGVMPDTFRFPSGETELWQPWALPPVEGEKGMKFGVITRAMARMRPGVTVAQVSAEGTARANAAPDAGAMGMALFGARGPIQVVAVDARDAATAEVRPVILILLAAAALLFVTAIANVANLQLARSAERQRELTIRAALGAGQAQLARQLLAENGILATLAGVTGIALSVWLHWLLPVLLPADFPRAEAIVFDVRVLLFGVALTLAAALTCGLLPILHARRLRLSRALSDSGSPGAGVGRSLALVRLLIVSSQVAVTCVLLVGGALLVRSFVAYLGADRGYDPVNVLTASIPFLPSHPVERRAQVLDAVVTRLKDRPGITHVAASTALPLVSSGGYQSFTFDSPVRPGTQVDVETVRRVVTPGYFGALALRLVAGRPLLDSDGAAAPPVVVVNRSFLRRYLEDVPPDRALGLSLGPRAVRGGANALPATIVGVVDDVKQDSPGGSPQAEMFVAYAQLPGVNHGFEAFLVLRTVGDPTAHVDTVRTLVREQDPTLALDSVMTMDERVGASLSRPRTYAVLLAGFAMSALLIAGAGLFGVLSHSVAQRSRELAVRAALGATRADIIRTAVTQMAFAMAGGLAVGLVLALALSSQVAPILYGVGATDATSFAVAALLLGVATLVGCLVPAGRVARLDPAAVLRQT